MIDFLMQIGTAFAALATLPQIVAVFQNKDSLRGYNSVASFVLFLAMISFGLAFYLMENWFSVLCEVPVAIFWLMASIYSFRIKTKRKN